jgi:peroxiredoxin
VRVVAISVDTPAESAALCHKAGYSFTFLSDEKREVIRQYDLVHAKGGPGSTDIARPAEFLLDSSGTVRWVNLTEDYRIRARPEQMLAAIEQSLR